MPIEKGKISGYRNAQTTVIAPTGTIGFMMDCDTTGIEPDLALVKYKKLVGGGVIKIVNKTVPQALIKLGYTPEQVEQIVSHIDATGTIEGAPHLKDEHLAVFDCSFRPQNGTRSIHHMGHVKMMAAVQPFISGAISKTINMPEESTVEEIMNAYIESWRLGSEGGRDLSRQFEARAAAQLGHRQGREEGNCAAAATTDRWRRSSTGRCGASCRTSGSRSRTSSRSAATRATSPSGCSRTARPGEIFITMAKEGSTISGLMDSFATAVSYALQYGVPLKFFVDKFSHVRFEPSGWTGNATVPYAKSIMDYIFRWLGAKFLGPEYAVGRGRRDAGAAADRAESAAGAAVRSCRCRRAAVRRMRVDHDAQRILLQVRELRRHQRL